MNKPSLLTSGQIFLLYIGLAVVYISGLFVPLMQNDSAQHASMAMRMVLTGDFLNLFKGENPYLDKPHMHFWLSALSMKLFGINEIAYRIPALLSISLGAFSTKRLTNLLYPNYRVGDLAALVFLSSQTIILSAHDVRTDAVLTGLVIFSIWQFIIFIKKGSAIAVILASIGAGLAFSTKGLMTLVIISFSVFAYLLYAREWKRFFTWKLILGLLAFIVSLIPILIAYHHQFGSEGIRFILLGQSVQRLTADGLGPNNSDYLFFFHTLLWAFLPFSLAFYFGVFSRTKDLIKNRFVKKIGVEFLTLGGFFLVMITFSFSKFKLPHYLNGLIAVLAILVASYLAEIAKKERKKEIDVLWIIQVVVIIASALGVGLLYYYFVDNQWIPLMIITGIGIGYLILTIFRKSQKIEKFIFSSLVFAIVINFFLNTQFYPSLLKYQGSYTLAKWVSKENIDTSSIFMLEGSESWAFDFYTKQNTPRVEEQFLKKGNFLVISSESLKELKRKYQIVHVEKDFRITRLSLKFLNPETRTDQLGQMYLVQIIE